MNHLLSATFSHPVDSEGTFLFSAKAIENGKAMCFGSYIVEKTVFIGHNLDNSRCNLYRPHQIVSGSSCISECLQRTMI